MHSTTVTHSRDLCESGCLAEKMPRDSMGEILKKSLGEKSRVGGEGHLFPI